MASSRMIAIYVLLIFDLVWIYIALHIHYSTALKAFMATQFALLFLGGLLNVITVAFNGGRMPYLPAFEVAGGPDSLHVLATMATRLPWLIDRFPPGGSSIGDLIVDAGTACILVTIPLGLREWRRSRTKDRTAPAVPAKRAREERRT